MDSNLVFFDCIQNHRLSPTKSCLPISGADFNHWMRTDPQGAARGLRRDSAQKRPTENSLRGEEAEQELPQTLIYEAALLHCAPWTFSSQKWKFTCVTFPGPEPGSQGLHSLAPTCSPPYLSGYSLQIPVCTPNLRDDPTYILTQTRIPPPFPEACVCTTRLCSNHSPPPRSLPSSPSPGSQHLTS